MNEFMGQRSNKVCTVVRGNSAVLSDVTGLSLLHEAVPVDLCWVADAEIKSQKAVKRKESGPRPRAVRMSRYELRERRLGRAGSIFCHVDQWIVSAFKTRRNHKKKSGTSVRKIKSVAGRRCPQRSWSPLTSVWMSTDRGRPH